MDTLEQEIIEKFYRLDEEARKRVRALIEQASSSEMDEAFDYEAWFREVEALRQQIKAEPGGVFPQIDVVSMLREIREGEDE